MHTHTSCEQHQVLLLLTNLTESDDEAEQQRNRTYCAEFSRKQGTI